MNDITQSKRAQMRDYIDREVISEQAVKAIVVIGSVAMGTAHAGSDIDAVVFMDPLDQYAVPAEFQWRSADGSYHGIFVDIPDAIQFDFKRLDWGLVSRADFQWSETLLAELVTGWLVFDRNGTIGPEITRCIAYDDAQRLTRLDEALIGLDQLLGNQRVTHTWSRLGAAVAHDRLNCAYGLLVQALFATNRRWRPWRSRELTHLLELPWLPAVVHQNPLAIVAAMSLDHDGYLQRANVLSAAVDQLVDHLRAEGIYAVDPVGEAFLRRNDEPGRDWNIETWAVTHQSRARR